MRFLSLTSSRRFAPALLVVLAVGCGTETSEEGTTPDTLEGDDGGSAEPGAEPEAAMEPEPAVEPEPAEPEAAEPEPAEPEPAEPEGAEPEAAEPEPAEPEPMDASPEPAPEGEPAPEPSEPTPDAAEPEPTSAEPEPSSGLPDAGDDDDGSSPEAGPAAPACGCESAPEAGEACTCAGCEEAIEVTSAVHQSEPIDYAELPPAGGDHASCWGAWGVHDTPLPDDNFVHNQEHGGVILLYNCPDGCDAELAELEAFVADHELTVLTEYPDMDARFAATSWGYRLLMECLDMDELSSFYDTHVDRAPEQFGRPPPDPSSGCP